ncbi:glycosyltransferase family 2 protein [Pedobacter sp. PLR]|uniref:glycosyltransferase family 2 protein n=1 Tax=Pedobacter sp. PLR TaxID=2994465 RepID=UPI002246E327|nr:glycosyltransferase family 2 protein [Pedobacter sp. PLR]MCX2449855.1 glycosyltransferase family 2 protein [Pedobacter sp. PLR]
MNFQPLVSVIIPTFNRASKLMDAIESAIDQTYKNTQIIVVDDGSSDGTSELIKKYPQVAYYYQKNGGQASARNKGLSYAEGTIIASLDSDDIWHEEFLEKCVHKLESEQLDFVFANWNQDAKIGSSWDFLVNDPFLAPYLGKERGNWINLEDNEVRSLYIESCPSPSSSVVLRKSSIVSGWDEKMNIGDDWAMYLEMILSKPCRAAFTLEKLWHKRVDDINIYDGRKWSEVLEFLHIADLKRNMDKLGNLLMPGELKILEERYMSSLVELSKHNLLREFKVMHSLRLLGTSFATNIPFTLKTIPGILFLGINRRLGLAKKKPRS